MNSKDNFQALTLRILLVIVSLAIMLPIVDDSAISFYVTVSVFVLGKLIDLTEKIIDSRTKMFFTVYLIDIILGILILAMCFYGFANVDATKEGKFLIGYNYILLCMTTLFCVADIMEFVSGICRLYHTKHKLKQIY